jgi:hypothetical protein
MSVGWQIGVALECVRRLTAAQHKREVWAPLLKRYEPQWSAFCPNFSTSS